MENYSSVNKNMPRFLEYIFIFKRAIVAASHLCVRMSVKQERGQHFLIFSKRKNGRINKNQ